MKVFLILLFSINVFAFDAKEANQISKLAGLDTKKLLAKIKETAWEGNYKYYLIAEPFIKGAVYRACPENAKQLKKLGFKVREVPWEENLEVLKFAGYRCEISW